MSDEILELYRSGEREKAMGLFVRSYQKKIYGLCFRMFYNYDDAMDASQETFIQVDKSLGSFRGDSSLDTWVYRVTAHVCLNFCRKNSKAIDKKTTRYGDSIEQMVSAHAEEPDSHCEKRHREKLIEAALHKLPADHRIAIILHELDHLSIAETAGAIDKSIPATKSLLHRARSSLRNILLSGVTVQDSESVGKFTFSGVDLQ